MQNLKHLVLLRRHLSSPKNFVKYWEHLYEDSKKRPDSQFLKHLKWRGGPLTSKDVRFLFGWKDGGRNRPSWSPEPTIRRLSRLNRLRFQEDDALVHTAKELSPSGPVKQFFICHIMSPFNYPIWDQNVLTSYLIISKREDELENVPHLVTRDAEYDLYRETFNQWVRTVPNRVAGHTTFPPFRRLDRALWAMGDYYMAVLHAAG